MPRPAPRANIVRVRILDRSVVVHCAEPGLRPALAAMFSGFATGPAGHHPHLRYTISMDPAASAFRLARPSGPALFTENYSDVLYLLEKDITIELQRARQDLYFLHAAAVSRNENAWLLAADSGGGKSTLTWALLHHGVDYLSDELSPVDLRGVRILPYRRALGLKRVLPSYPPPATAIGFDSACYIPAFDFPEPANINSVHLAGIFFVGHQPERRQPKVTSVGSAEASARLYTLALNALAHADRGLEAAVHIAESVPCFALASADLEATALLVRSMIDEPGRGGQPNDQQAPS